MRHIYLLLILFCGLVGSQNAFADEVPLDGRWEESDARSLSVIPFSVEKEGNTLYVTSSMKVEGVTVRVVSDEGAVLYEEISTFFPSETMSLPLGDLEDGEYAIEFYHKNGHLRGEF